MICNRCLRLIEEADELLEALSYHEELGAEAAALFNALHPAAVAMRIERERALAEHYELYGRK